MFVKKFSSWHHNVFKVSIWECCYSVTGHVDAVPDGSGALEKEEEFIQRCMDSLTEASSQLEQVSLGVGGGGGGCLQKPSLAFLKNLVEVN